MTDGVVGRALALRRYGYLIKAYMMLLTIHDQKLNGAFYSLLGR